MKTIEKWIIEVMHVLIPGFFYMVALFILIYTLNSTKALSISFIYKDYSMIIVIVVLLISYVIGFSMDLAIQKLVWYMKPESKERFVNSIEQQNDKDNNYGGYYFGLLLIRHLIISVFLLVLVLTYYFIKFEMYKMGVCIVVFCILFSIILYFAYKQLQTKVNIVNKPMNKKKLENEDKNN